MDEARWQALSQHLAELFDMDPALHAAYLARIAADDTAMATELARLLEAEAREGLIDEGMAGAAPAILGELTGGSAAAAASGHERRAGPYRLTECIGRGGMGEVWRGERDGDFAQVVAVKLIRPLLDSPHLRERFARERRILARLEHPGIARLFDGGVTDDGIPWYAMEFVRGQDIVRHAQEKQLGLRERVELMLQVCDAAAYAQAQLVVHRDIKPSNLLMDETGRVRVLDFGIAHLLDDSLDSRLTGTNMRLYSPSYAAPEQIRGQRIGTATDVFSLGAVLYELITGQPPYPARGAAPDRLLATLDEETAPRPSRALRASTGTSSISLRGLDADLDTIVATALQPEAARRYVGAAQLAEDLRRWLDGHPIAARPDTTGYRVARFVSRHRLAVASAGAVLLALVVGLGVALWQAQIAREQAERSQQTFNFVMSLINQMTPARTGTDMTVNALLHEGLKRIDEELPDAPDIRAFLRGDFAKALSGLGEYEAALPHQERAVREHEALPATAQRDRSMASGLVNLALSYRQLARLEDAENAARSALTLLEPLPGNEHRIHAIRARSVLANIATRRNRTDEAIALHERVLADRSALPDVGPAELAVDYNNLAAAHLAADRYVEAERRYRELDALLQSDPSTPPSRRVYTLMGLATALYGQARHDEAIGLIDAMQELGTRTLNPEHPIVVNGDVLRARIALAQGADGEADALFAAAIPKLTPQYRGAAELHWGIGLMRQGREADALAQLDAAVKHLTDGSAQALLANTAHAALRARKEPQALDQARQNLARFVDSAQTQIDEYPHAMLLLADVIAHHGGDAEAQALRREAADAFARIFGPGHPDTLAAMAAAQG